MLPSVTHFFFNIKYTTFEKMVSVSFLLQKFTPPIIYPLLILMRRLILILIALIVCSGGFAQGLFTKKVKKYSLKDGLSFGIINSITQDNKGFMWFATGDGLNRFDGTNFKVFKFEPDNPYSLPSNY